MMIRIKRTDGTVLFMSADNVVINETNKTFFFRENWDCKAAHWEYLEWSTIPVKFYRWE